MENLPTRNNNPGDIKDTSTGTFKHYSNPQEGFAALMNDLQAKKTGATHTGLGPNSTLVDFAKAYAPPSENNSAQYAANLANHMGIRPDATLSTLDVGKWAEAVANAEGYHSTQQGGGYGYVSPSVPASIHDAPGATGTQKKDLLEQASGLLNHVFPAQNIGKVIGTELAKWTVPAEQQQYLDTNSGATAGGVAGDIAQNALYFTPVGKVAGLAEKGIAGAVPAVGKAGAKALANIGTGVATGYGFDVASKLSSGQDNVLTPGLGTALGAGAGVLGAGVGVAGAIRGPVAEAERNVKALGKLENYYKDVQKVVNKAGGKGIDVKGELAKSGLLNDVVDSSGHINTQDAMAALNEYIKPQEDVISRSLANEGRRIALTDVEKILKDAVKSSGVEGGALTRALNNVDDDVAGYALRADLDGMVPLSVIHDAKVSKYSTINYLNPETKIVDKTIARSLKGIVEHNTKSVDVKALNEELQKHYSTLNLLEKLNGKKVEGGKLGKYFARTVGSIVGSHFGPLGSIVGAEAGGRVLGQQMKNTFGKSELNLRPSAAMEEAVRKGAMRRLPIQEAPTSFTNDVGTIKAGPPAVRPKDDLPVIEFGQSSKSTGNLKSSQAKVSKKITTSKARAAALKKKSGR